MKGIHMDAFTRRRFITGITGSAALAAASAALPTSARSMALLAGAQGPGVYRYKLGAVELTALYDGAWFLPIEPTFTGNASAGEVDAALEAAFLPPRVLPISFTALLVNDGKQLTLIDTGTAGQIVDTAGFLNANLTVAGIKPEAIDRIIISHFHPDHIDGIKTKDGAKVFPNAEILVPEPEWAFWMDEGNMSRASGAVHRYFLNAHRIFKDIAKEVHRFKPGSEVAPGIGSIPAYGHTPGHTAFEIHSDKESLLVMSDTAREPWLFVRHPEWQPSYDMDGPLAVHTRKAMLDRAATDRMLVEAYHFPFPACGHIARTATGYELVPTMWRPL
jgi:glyoxylase-like metal-dependent hydrolase (beta-lactamase superfamily II)